MERVLDYHDVLLREADVALLDGSAWLNDQQVQIIAFYFEYLQREGTRPDDILFVPPSATFLIVNGGAGFILEPLQFASKSLTFFALNDNADVEHAAGGSHWSLVVYCAADNTAHHYDSLHGSNTPAAAALFKALNPHLPSTATLVEQPTPQQQNSNDCGMYVLAIADLLAKRYTTTGQPSLEVTPGDATPRGVSTMRHSLRALIHELASHSVSSP